MNYKGAYDSSQSYSVGDVVVYTDSVPYVCFATAPAGAVPHDVHYWNILTQPFRNIVIMFHGMFGTIADAIPKNIDDEAITLKTDDGEYLITVDDSGDTPELTVTEIEEEAEEGDT